MIKELFQAFRWLAWDWIPGLLEERKIIPHTAQSVMFLGFCFWVSGLVMWQYNAWAEDLNEVIVLTSNVKYDMHDVSKTLGVLQKEQRAMALEVVCFQLESESRQLTTRIFQMENMDSPRDSDNERRLVLEQERDDMQARRENRGCLK